MTTTPATPTPAPTPSSVTTDPAAPWQITGGQPTAEETAALTAVLTALLARHATTSRREPSRPTATDTVWDRAHHNPHTRTGTWRAR